MQQLRTFLIQNIPADVSYFELYSGIDVDNLTLAKTRIIPDKFGTVKINLSEYRRVPIVYYKWKVVDVFGNKSDFSNASIIELDQDKLFNKFILQEITPDNKINLLETPDPFTLVGIPTIEGFSRYSSSIRKINNEASSFSDQVILYSNQTNNSTIHNAYIQAQPNNDLDIPNKVYAGDKLRIFWRAEASITASVGITGPESRTYSTLFSSATPISLSGVIEDLAPSTLGLYTATITSQDENSNIKTKDSHFEVISGSNDSTLNVDNVEISVGSIVNLSWDLGALGVQGYIDNGIGLLPTATGSLALTPETTTTYTLITHFSDGAVGEKSVTVTVNTIPIITRFSAERTSIENGESLHLVWGASNINSLVIDQGIGQVLSSPTDLDNIVSSIDISPTSNTTYTLTASNENGDIVTATFSVTVTEVPQIISFENTQTSLMTAFGPDPVSTEFNYSVINADTVTIEGPDGNIFGPTNTLVGNYIVNNLVGVSPTTERKITYKLTATKGSVNKTAKISYLIDTIGAYLDNISLPGSTVDLTNIPLAFDYALLDNATLTLENENIIIPDNILTSYQRDGSISSLPTQFIDFSNAIDSMDYANGDPVTFILTGFGPATKIIKTVKFDNTGLISVT